MNQSREYFISEQIYDLYEKVKSNQIIEQKMEYHEEIAEALKNDYDLAFDCFASCSVEFYMWFTKDYLYKLVEIIKFHGKKELLLLLKNHLLELVDNNPYDPRIDNITVVYHMTYKILR